MAISRRTFLKNSALSAFGLSALATPLRAEGPQRVETPRIIFIRKGNGLFPSCLVPPSLSDADKKREKEMAAFEADLSKHELPDWLTPLNKHKNHLTLLQGLSAKMCSMGHDTWQSPMGVFRGTGRTDSITRATVDVELGRLLPSPMEHIELTCARNQKGIVSGYSAIGPKQPNIAFASPRAAFENLFAASLDIKEIKMDIELDDRLLAFINKNIGPKADNLNYTEGEQKVGTYADSVETLRNRNKLLLSMSNQIKKHLPRISGNVMQDQCTTIERQEAFTDILLSALCAGLTNVITYTIDDLRTTYTGLFDFEIDLHPVGHDEVIKGVAASEVRTKLRAHHMNQVNRMVERLKNTPEGNGSIFDNTIIMYMPENGEKHHSHGTEVPFVILAGDKVKLKNIGGRYIRLPNYNEPGHKTVGNFFTTLLNVHGNPIKHYGNFDIGLTIDQTGPIQQLMG